MRMYTVKNMIGKVYHITAETKWHAISKAVALDNGQFPTFSYRVMDKQI